MAPHISCPADAHDSPSHTVEELTEHIRREGESVPLLLRRASDLRVLGEHERAIADWLRVLQLEPKHQGALAELAREHLALGHPAEASVWIDKALAPAGPPSPQNAHLYALRGEVRTAQKQWEAALTDYNAALAHDPGAVDWYLARADLQYDLNRNPDRLAGLRAGYDRTRSEVLYIAWVEALIETGHAADALQEIEPRLAASRLRSSWLIRRARALLALPAPQRDKAHQDLTEAIAELNMRLRRGRPSGDLLLDRAQARRLQGKPDEAAADLAAAEKSGADTRRLQRLRKLPHAATSSLR